MEKEKYRWDVKRAVDFKGAALELSVANNMSVKELGQLGDIRTLVENSCVLCDKLLMGSETKLVPPKYLQERDRFVKAGLVWRRLMCLSCYNHTREDGIVRDRERKAGKEEDKSLTKSLINSFLMQGSG